MKLDHNAVRSLLLHFEDKLEINDRYNIIDLELPEITNESIIYTSLKLVEAGYINGKPIYSDNGIHVFLISSITWDGHEFLDNIRDPEILDETTKMILSKVGSVSLDLLS